MPGMHVARDSVQLADATLCLRRFTLSDAPAVQTLAGDVAIADTTLNISHPYPPGAAEEWIAGHETEFERKSSAIFAVAKLDGVLVGCISVGLNAEYQHGEIGYWIGRPFWNRGYGTAALRLLLRYCFAQLSLHRVYAHHMARNPASGRVMQKAGLRHEGMLREHIVKADRYEDVVLYGMLQRDWVDACQQVG